MKRLLIGLVVLAAALMGNAAFAQKSPEAEFLNHYVGTWKSEAVFKPSKWLPEGWEGVGTVDAKWILDGNLQQMEIIFSDLVQILVIQRYNQKTNRYERWRIDSWGSSSYWLGRSHNEEVKSMTWKYVDFGSGLSGTIVDLFSEGKVTTSIIWRQQVFLKDVHGNVLLDGVEEARRTEQPAE